MAQKQCLIVDDSPVVRQLLTLAIENVGLNVDEAEDGVLAFAKCVVSMPDVIVLDWNMPNMDGVTFLKKLRGYEGGDKPKIIFCTVESDESKKRMVMDLGADDYIVKPFTRNHIHESFLRHGVIQPQ